MEMHGGAPRIIYRGPSAAAVVFLALLFGLLGGVGGTAAFFWASRQPALQQYIPYAATDAGATGHPVTTGQPAALPATTRLSFIEVADLMDESVVNINTLARQENPFSLFFGGGPQVVKGLGTGVIVDTKGYILTNYHVVGEADNIKVTVMHASGKQEYTAKFIGGDKQEDLAVIKIDAKNLKPARFGDSDKLRPGEPVMAIGNPFGFEHTVSVGVVSALNRDLPVDDTVTLKRMVQTDASINPGNSGGPLVNQHGEVVGINSAVYLGNGGNSPQANSIGFSIPSNRAKTVMEMLRDKKKIAHPYIGIGYDPIDDELRRAERLPVKNGVIIRGVMPNSPAAKAKLQKDDIILSIDNRELKDRNTLSDYVANKPVNAVVTLQIMRWDAAKGDWAKQTVKVKIADKPADFEQTMRGNEQQPDEGVPEEQPGEAIPFPWPF